jgi:hypothetical protein
MPIFPTPRLFWADFVVHIRGEFRHAPTRRELNEKGGINMYLVVSHWEPLPGKEEEFDRVGGELAAFLRAQPGVKFIEGFTTEGGKHVSLHAYEDEAVYRRLVLSDDSPFEKEVARRNVEAVGRWLGSERGESVI